jgi:hypothetical protein
VGLLELLRGAERGHERACAFMSGEDANGIEEDRTDGAR